MTSLKKQADELGIEIDGRWSDETLKEKIEEARSKKTRQQIDQGSSANANRAEAVAAAGTPEPAPTPAAGEAKVIPNIGVGRVQTAEEVQQDKEGAGRPVAPYPGDPREAHALAVEQSMRAAASPNPSDLPTAGLVPAEGQKEEFYPIRLLFDWWDGQGVRHPMGDIVEMPLNEAQKLMDEGKGEYAGKMSPIGR